jgi:predicted phage terminase large subunit-like protein
MRRTQITEKQFALQIEELRSLIRESVSPFEKDTPAKKKVRIERARKDKDFFFHSYLPHYFYKPSAEFHKELHALAEEPLAAIAAPRGHAKSTHISFGESVHDICYGLEKFIIIASDTTTQAEDFTTAIKLELEENPRIKHDFGELIPKSDIGYHYDDFITANDIRVLARGRGSRIRGLKHKQYRPTKFVGDDIENDENVRSLEQRKFTLSWLLRAVRGGLEPEGSKMYLIGTILHYDSVLAQLIDPRKNEEWKKRKYRAISSDGKILWPERWPREKLEREKRIMGSIAFNQEFQNDPIDPDMQIFREEWIKYYDPSTIDVSEMDIYTATDPSVAKTEQSDYQAIVTIGIPRAGEKKGFIYVLDADIGRTSPKKLAAKIFAKYERYRCITHGFEDIAFQDVMKQWIDDLSRENRIYLPCVGISQRRDKIQRITRLSPLVENGTILFRRDQVLLVEQVIHFPKADHDDGPDALEMAVGLARASGPAVSASSEAAKGDYHAERKRRLFGRLDLRRAA